MQVFTPLQHPGPLNNSPKKRNPNPKSERSNLSIFQTEEKQRVDNYERKSKEEKKKEAHFFWFEKGLRQSTSISAFFLHTNI